MLTSREKEEAKLFKLLVQAVQQSKFVESSVINPVISPSDASFTNFYFLKITIENVILDISYRDDLYLLEHSTILLEICLNVHDGCRLLILRSSRGPFHIIKILHL